MAPTRNNRTRRARDPFINNTPEDFSSDSDLVSGDDQISPISTTFCKFCGKGFRELINHTRHLQVPGNCKRSLERETQGATKASKTRKASASSSSSSLFKCPYGCSKTTKKYETMQHHIVNRHYTPPADFVALLELEHTIPRDICDSLRSEMALIPLALAYAAGIENAVYIPAFWTNFHSWSQLTVNRQLMRNVRMGKAINDLTTQDRIVDCFRSIAASVDATYQAPQIIERAEAEMHAVEQIELQNHLAELSKSPFFDLPLISEIEAMDFLAEYCSLPQTNERFDFDLDTDSLPTTGVPVADPAYSFEIPAYDPSWIDIAPLQDYNPQMTFDNGLEMSSISDYTCDSMMPTMPQEQTSFLGQQMVWV